jgi:hypothetical protein
MLFTIVIAGVLLVVVAVIAEEALSGMAGSVMLSASVLFTFSSFMNHADNLGTVRAYAGVIEANEKRVVELRGVLNEKFDVTKTDASLLLNADSPARAVVDSLAEATKDLAGSRKFLAATRVEIEQRKAGPFWFVVSLYGEK